MPGVYPGQVSTSASIQDRPGLPLAGACCAPLLREPIPADRAVGLARMAEALADPTRLRLVSLVAAHDDGEAGVCEPTQLPSRSTRSSATSSSTAMSRGTPSRITRTLGALSTASRSSVRLARTSCPIPISALVTSTMPKSASCG